MLIRYLLTNIVPSLVSSALIFIFAILISGIARLLVLGLIPDYCVDSSDLSILCFSSDLNKSYLEQKSLNSSEAIAITVKHIDKSIVALAILQIVNSSILSIFIVFGLINSSFAITLSSFALFSFLYYGISCLTSVVDIK